MCVLYTILVIGVLINIRASLRAHFTSDTVFNKKELQQQNKQKKIQIEKMLIIPPADPGNTPKLQLTLGAGDIISWQNSKTNLELASSNMPFMLVLSITGTMTYNFNESFLI